MGAFYIFTSWALLVGWGTNNLNAFVEASENPVFLLAHRLWGVAWIIVFLAVINSILAVSIATTNAATRVFFAMGRSGVLPGWLSQVHPVHRTPSNAILLQTFITFAFGLGLGLAIGPDQEFFLMGVAITLGLIFVYSMGNVGVFRFYRAERPGEFNVLLHVVFPLLSTIALLWVGYKSIVPLPDPPVSYAPFIVGVWLVVGIVLVWLLSRTGREEWLRKAGAVMGEESASEGPRGA
jgi:amino acid transporter